MTNGYFDGSMPRSVLEYYLSHAASAQWITQSETLEDDIRVILKTGIKFLGRAAGIWKGNGDEEGHFARVKAAADRVTLSNNEDGIAAALEALL